MNIIKQHQEVLLQYLKAIIFIGILLLCFIASAHASDSTGIDELDTKSTMFQQGVKVFAKWGGILAVVISALLIGFGKAQGQTAQLLAGTVICCGLGLAGWGWYSSGSFANGFAF